MFLCHVSESHITHNQGPDLNETDLPWLRFKHPSALQLYQVFTFLIIFLKINQLLLVSGLQFLIISLQAINPN